MQDAVEQLAQPLHETHELRDLDVRARRGAGSTIARWPVMDVESARSILLAQHDRIRGDLNRCCSLARRLCNGEPSGLQLDIALTQLRADLTQHNATESEWIGPLLHDLAGWGTVLIDRMLEEHLAEHGLFWELLSGSVQEVAMRMAHLADELEAHMAAEERTFLSPLVLRHDVIARHRIVSSLAHGG